jgi:hypothetical protein
MTGTGRLAEALTWRTSRQGRGDARRCLSGDERACDHQPPHLAALGQRANGLVSTTHCALLTARGDVAAVVDRKSIAQDRSQAATNSPQPRHRRTVG